MKAHKPVVVLALDGLDPLLLNHYIRAGHLPSFAKLKKQVWQGGFKQALPLVSPVIWNTVLTGVNPGVHGVVDLVQRQQHDYGLSPISGSKRMVPTMVPHIMNYRDKVACIGVPGTYPAEDCGATVISGFDAPWQQSAYEKTFQPGKYGDALPSFQWNFGSFNEYLGNVTSIKQGQYIYEAISDDFQRKHKFILTALHAVSWDLFIAHFQTADTASHHLWHFEDPRSPFYPGSDKTDSYVLKIYKQLDQFLNDVMKTVPDHALFILSDHGMGAADNVVLYLNRFLEQLGYLEFLSQTNVASPISNILKTVPAYLPDRVKHYMANIRVPEKLTQFLGQQVLTPKVNWHKTSVWAQEIDASPALHFNLQSRDNKGIVKPEYCHKIYEKIRYQLLQLQHPLSGRALIKEVHLNTDVYKGPAQTQAADMIIEPAMNENMQKVSFAPSLGKGPCIEMRKHPGGKGWGMPGVHRGGGILWAYGIKPLKPFGSVLAYEEFAAIVCSTMGIPKSERMTDSGFLPTTQIDSDSEMYCRGYQLTEREQREISKHLSDFGYIG